MKFPPAKTMPARGFTLIEVLIAAAILILLAALLFPTFGALQRRAALAQCTSNLRQISAASVIYSNEHDGKWPPNAVGTVYANYLIPYLGNIPAKGAPNFLNSPLICPTSKVDEPEGNYRHRGIYTPTSYTDPDTGKVIAKYGLSYGQNAFAPGVSGASTAVPNRLSVEAPSKMMLYMEIDGHYLAPIGRIVDPDHKEILKKRHNNIINVAYADGSVRGMAYEDIPTTSTGKNADPFWNFAGSQY